MKQTSKILAIGAHPDDIEFGCGAILLSEVEQGAEVSLLLLSRGEAGSNGTPEERMEESRAAAKLLGANMHLLALDGDAQLEYTSRNALQIARVIRELQPDVLLAPSLSEDQHPDHWKAGKLARDACRLARYGGLAPLAELEPHVVSQLYFYDVTGLAPMNANGALLYDISAQVDAWKQLMQCHASQMQTRNYAELRMMQATLLGQASGVGAAQVLYPNAAPIVRSLATLNHHNTKPL